MEVLVTGGSGFIGKRLRLIKPDWIYLSSEDYNLTRESHVIEMMGRKSPHAIVHLAATVGGIKANAEYPTEFYYENIMMNSFVVQFAKDFGVQRLLASMSTCAFPDVVDKYPFTEEQLLNGPPAQTNISYGLTKRAMYIHINAVRQQFNLNYSTFCPSNVYGPEDSFDPATSHFVSQLVQRLYHAKDGDTLEFWGTGKPMRQQLFVDDLVKIIPILLEQHNTDFPIIVAPDENLTIDEMINIGKEVTNKDVKITYNGLYEGQYRKDGSNKRLKALIGEFDFISFKDGFQQTYEWYDRHKPV